MQHNKYNKYYQYIAYLAIEAAYGHIQQLRLLAGTIAFEQKKIVYLLTKNSLSFYLSPSIVLHECIFKHLAKPVLKYWET